MTAPLALESRVTELWGQSQWDWVIGRTLRKDGDVDDFADHIWFFFCGSDPEIEGKWLHHGYGENIADVLTQMIALGEERHD